MPELEIRNTALRPAEQPPELRLGQSACLASGGYELANLLVPGCTGWVERPG